MVKKVLVFFLIVMILSGCAALPQASPSEAPSAAPQATQIKTTAPTSAPLAAPTEAIDPTIALPLPSSVPNNQEKPVSSTPDSSNMPQRQAPANPYAPVPEDKNMVRGEVFLEPQSVQLVTQESFPPQVVLNLSGDLPTPCHQLRVLAARPDAQNNIQVDVYSVSDPNKMCTQVLQPFEARVPLGSYPSGEYSVYINGQLIGKIKL